MALTDENMGMPVAPAYGGGGFGNGFGGDGWWLILLFLLVGGNGFGWGNGFGGGFGAMYEFPWLLNGQAGINANTNNGFRDAMINDNITSVRDGIADISTQLCGGFAGVTAAVNGAQNAVSQQLYTNQIADMERSFNAQTASTQGMNAIQSQLAQCCCDNRAATADVKYTIATEACANSPNSTANTQAILDKLCQQEIEALKAQNQQLQMQGYLANLEASQNAQTGQLLADNAAQTATLRQALNPTPIPAFIVNNPNGCNCNTGCGCGGNGFYN